MYELFITALTMVRSMWRFRWYAMAAAWVVFLASAGFVSTMDDQYRAEARVYIDSQSLLRPLLEGLAVDPDVETTIDAMSRTLLGRPNLETVLRETDIGLRADTPKEKAALIGSLQNKVVIDPPSKGRSNLYSISYTDTDPEIAHQVVQQLLTTWMEGALGSSRQQAASAQQFLVKQVEEYERRLNEAEQRLADFKKKHVGSMPSEGRGYYDRMQSLMDELNNKRRKLRAAQNRRNELVKQLEGEKAVLGASEIDKKIQEKTEELDNLLLKYTDEHPDVIALRETIDQLKQQKKQGIKQLGGASDEEASLNPVYQSLKISISEAEVEISTLKSEIADMQAKVDELKELVDTVPEVEAQLQRLTRDYEVTKSQYEALLSRLESARISEDVDSAGDKNLFRVVEPPVVPLSPAGPPRLLYLVMAFAAALGAGGGLAYLLSEVWPVYCTSEELHRETGLPVLGSVSIKWTDEERRAVRRDLVYLILAGLGLGAVFAGFVVIELAGPLTQLTEKLQEYL